MCAGLDSIHHEYTETYFRTLLSTGVLAAIQAGAASMPASLRGAGTSAGAKASAVATGAAVSAAHLHHLSFRAVIYHWELIVRTIRAVSPAQYLLTRL